MWLESEMVPVDIVDIVVMDDNMGVEGWFDELGKDGVRLTTCDEGAGF